MNIITENDIVFLYESWTCSSSDIELNGYISYNFYRKFQHRNAKRQSGGIVLYFKESLKNGIEIVKNHADTIIWIKLNHEFFHFDTDVYICGTYLWGEESPAYNIASIDLFELLENDVDCYSNLGSVYIIGDLNSRVGAKSDSIIHDRINQFIDDTDYIPDVTMCRASIDKICNSHGTKLLDLCKSSCLRIVNGRLGDTNAFTFVSQHGTSVIDYLLTKESNFSQISNFVIESMNIWSDHTPIHFILRCNNFKPVDEEILETKIKWDQMLRDRFRSELIIKLPDFNRLTYNIDPSNRKSINDVMNNFTNTIRNVADPLFSKCFTHKKSSYFRDAAFVKHADWFDKECIDAKNQYLESLRIFNGCKNTVSREYFCKCKKFYKETMRKKKRSFEYKKLKDIENLKHCNPKQFWKYFKKNKSAVSNGISLEDFREYFANLSNDILQGTNEDAENFCDNHDFNDSNCAFEELDQPITITEILTAIKLLKAGKAMGSDSLMNEYFIESMDILGSHLCDIFNAILNSGFFPDKWTEGVIIPIHKKGNIDDVNNYRGITLVSCLSKLFTTIINKRIESFCNNNNVISDAQFGFRKGRSTVDAIFVLMSIIQKYLNDNKRLYVVYVDMMKCFDSIYRNALWLKLYKTGIQGKVLRIIRDMYQKVKSCVKSCNNYSDYFEYAVGLRQGEVISPILFSLFVEDLELYLQSNVDSGLHIDDIVLILLLFADDMAILGKTPEELQANLNLLHTYCDNWGLKVNIAKTKIMVFRKRGRLLPNESWTYGGQNIEVVDDFNYLGTVFNYTGNYTLNQEHLIGKALKALNVLFVNCKKFDLKPRILCQLFDAFVGSILNYSCEIWGYTKSKEIERIHLKFCKRLLNVRINTCTAGVYGELGRYPLYITRYVRIVKYWCKVLNSDNILIQKLYEQGLHDCNRGRKNWVFNVKKLLSEYGFAYIFDNTSLLDPKLFACIFKQRVVDTFIQGWFGSIANSTVLDNYKMVKLTFAYEAYLDILPRNLRLFYSRMRLSVHPLRIQTGRFARNRIPRDERHCLCCHSLDIEDEYHFICICSCFSDIRKKYINKYYYQRPSMLKYLDLLKSNNKTTLIKLSRYIKDALNMRNSILNVEIN